MRVLVVGSGAREHALAWSLSRSPDVVRVYAAPGNAGMEAVATRVPAPAEDVRGLLDLVERESIDLTVVGPEGPLVGGLVDAFEERGLAAFGPTSAGARIEGSKAWAKSLFAKYGIPAPRSDAFTDVTSAIMHLDAYEPPYVIKADGLAAGKGVVIAQTREEAVSAIEACLVDRRFGDAGDVVLIEEHLAGREASVLALTDGERVLPLEPARDYKRALDGDRGLNTGGMGAFSPVPEVDRSVSGRIASEILEPTVRALAEEGIPYRGVLYAGLMLTAEGPKVLEYNCRFGDPETEAILPRLDGDLAGLLAACARGDLGHHRARWRPYDCVTVVLASGGYPAEYRTGVPIEGLEKAEDLDDVFVFHAGTAHRDGRVVTAGGRVAAVSALGSGLAEARDRAYEACGMVIFEGKHYRTDIGEEEMDG